MSTDDTIFDEISQEMTAACDEFADKGLGDLVQRVSLVYIDWLREQPDGRDSDQAFDELSAVVMSFLYIISRGIANSTSERISMTTLEHSFLSVLHDHFSAGSQAQDNSVEPGLPIDRNAQLQ